MIRNIHISAFDEDGSVYETEPTEPPARILDVAVVGSVATLSIYELGERSRLPDEPTADVRVPAQSLLLALQALVSDQAG